MNRSMDALSMASILLVFFVLLIIAIKADLTEAGETRKIDPIIVLNATKTPNPPPGQTIVPKAFDQAHMPLIMAMNVTSSITPTGSPHTPTRGPTATPLPSP